MPRIDPNKLFKAKEQQIINEKENITESSSDEIERADVQTNARTYERAYVQTQTSVVTNYDFEIRLREALEKLNSRFSKAEIDSEMARNRTRYGRSSYTLSDDVLGYFDTFYEVARKKNKKLNKQDLMELIIRHFLKDAIKIGDKIDKNLE